MSDTIEQNTLNSRGDNTMKAIWVIFVLILIGGSFMFFNSEDDDVKTASQPSNAEAITYDAITAEVENGDALLLDVRTPTEYKEGYIAPAKNHSLQLLSQGQLPDVDSDETVYLYCRTGNRSAEAAAILSEAGYSHIIDLGGLQDMIDIGGELTVD